MGFPTADSALIWRIVGAILLLGDVTFKKQGDGSCIDFAPPQLAKMLGTNLAEIERGLTHSTVIAAGQQVVANSTPVQAEGSRDTLCKAMYQRLFGWVCKKLNVFCALVCLSCRLLLPPPTHRLHALLPPYFFLCHDALRMHLEGLWRLCANAVQRHAADHQSLCASFS